ncbi:RNA polymerase III-inhibiting protein maf1 [Pestalotiopsis sp. 9143b]|nr:RNA polymerase III-inhibiting protein maf1 [Pestalotiopsis sp. 9143b]
MSRLVFLPIRDFDTVTSALNFTTPDLRVNGGCDLYTTKAAGSDRKLYKSIDQSLESKHAALLKFGASLSPPQREQMAASLNLSRSSPFGPLSDIQSRRTFAYLIATLNASHPDYDFSHVLRPSDFRRERNLRRAIAAFDSTLNNVRPPSLLTPAVSSSYRAYGSSPSSLAAAGGTAISSPPWGPQMWAMIDKEMKLKDCVCFSYQPATDPFDGEEAAIWRMHYFFFNKSLKRVAYMYVRGVPSIMHSSPALKPNGVRRGSSSVLSPSLASSGGANKRANYWLGDSIADRVIESDGENDEDDTEMEIYDPDEDIDFDPLNTASSKENSEDEYLQSESEDEDDDDEMRQSPVRGVSEDIASQMELE